jgi:hypothetical protein
MKRPLIAAKPAAPPVALFQDVRGLILTVREGVAQSVNSALALLGWGIGTRIRTEILKEKRADHGQRILHALSAKLAAEFGRGFSERNLFNMVRFAEVFPLRQVPSPPEHVERVGTWSVTHVH